VLIGLYAGLHALGLDRPVDWTADGWPVPGPGFWLWTVAFLALFLACVVGVVRVMWPAEVGPLPGWDRPTRTQRLGRSESRRGALAGAGAAVIGIGTLMLAATGLAGFPLRVTWFAGVPLNALAAMLLMALGGLMVRHGGATPTGDHSSATIRNSVLP
jgi:hypothetical protein